MPQGWEVNKILLVGLILLSLCACGPAQLSTDETCSEANAIVTSFGGDSGEEIQEVGEQLSDLAERASDPLRDELTLLADVAASGSEARNNLMNDPEQSQEFEDAYTTVSEVCEF